jgi:hypothetical protein
VAAQPAQRHVAHLSIRPPVRHLTRLCGLPASPTTLEIRNDPIRPRIRPSQIVAVTLRINSESVAAKMRPNGLLSLGRTAVDAFQRSRRRTPIVRTAGRRVLGPGALTCRSPSPVPEPRGCGSDTARGDQCRKLRCARAACRGRVPVMRIADTMLRPCGGHCGVR